MVNTLLGRMSAATDVGRAFVPYLNWSSKPRLTLAICQVTILAAIATFFALPYIPWRAVLFLAGEATFAFLHPSVQRILQGTSLHDVLPMKQYEDAARKLMRLDSLPDAALDPRITIRDVVVWEEEGINADSTVASHRFMPPLAEHQSEVKPRERSPPDGWDWLEEDWFVDRSWSTEPFDKGALFLPFGL
jgi:hypothetical protein